MKVKKKINSPIKEVNTTTMSKNTKLATWNLCLGLPNKKDLVTKILSSNNICACCVQETEIPTDYPEEILDCNGYILELELNNQKKGLEYM